MEPVGGHPGAGQCPRDGHGQREPGRAPDGAADDRGRQRLVGDHPAYLARSRADQAHQGDLAAALRHRERERAADHEDRDDPGEGAHGGEEPDRVRPLTGAGVTSVGVGGVIPVQHRQPGWELGAKPGDQRALADAGRCEHTHGVHLPLGSGQGRCERCR